MSLYEEYCAPHLTNCLCGMPEISKQRQKVVPHARGRVLEVGMGSGLNLAHYNPDQVEFVWGLEPNDGMRRKAQKNLDASPLEVKWLGLPSEEISLDDDSADTVLLTYTLCSIEGWLQALHEMRRVLKPGGVLLFCEHGLSPDTGVRKWQQRINPVWRVLTAGCNLTREVPGCLAQGGFAVDRLDSGYIKGPKFATYNYWGSASLD
ncbi:MAG: class I SAM-dependent methyltransferase [Pseudomonadota bacterium]